MKLNIVFSYFLSVSMVMSHGPANAQSAFNDRLNAMANSSTIQSILSGRSILKAGSTVFETSDLIKIYNERNFEPIWIRNGQKTEFVDAYKIMVTQLSLKHGLIASDYMTSELEAYLGGLTPENSLATEVLMSNLYLRLASNISDGRIEPTTIDNDVRFKKRIFQNHKVLAQAVSSVPSMMSPLIESLAPEHIYYKDTLSILAELNAVKSMGGYTSIKNPKTIIKLNTQHALVPALRQRVIQHGYALTGSGLNYDQELSLAVQEIQKENGFSVSADLLPDSGVWNLFGVGVDARIIQTQANLEKLRWLPKKLEPNMVFVNTNATEMKIFENNQVVKKMVTINGRALRPTPMMQTWLTHVILNTTWTATDSVILQDKLPEIQKNVGFLKRIRMNIINKETGAVIDPATLDWKNNSRGIAKNYRFVMDPGPKNALGVYKFPLSSDKNSYGSNADDIFMHFTDDPSLFSKTSRHLSSGCVRLSEAKWFAEYLLKNNSQYTPEYIDSVVSKGIEGEIFDSNIRIKLNPEEFRPVYTVPLTVEKTESGHARFMKDVYLQDRRIQQSAMSIAARAEQTTNTQVMPSLNTGSLQVSGVAGPMQYNAQVVVQKCQQPESKINVKTSMRKLIHQCSSPIRFALNSKQNLEQGSYIVGFENTIYPGFVHIQAGASVQIDLQKISIPENMMKDRQIKVYIDMGSLTEQKKIYFQKYYSGQNLFRKTIRSFGDFSIAGSGEVDVATAASYNFCSEKNMNKLVLAKDIREHALFVCESFNSAQSMYDMADLYRFNINGTYQEATVDDPGDIIPKRYLRLLVSAPLKAGEFVSVMPGHYRISTDVKTSARLNLMTVEESYPVSARQFAKSRLSAINSNEVSEGDLLDKNQTSDVSASLVQMNQSTDLVGATARCQNATTWRTNLRSYCTQDELEGCDRSKTSICEEIKLDLRFRK